MKKTIAAILVTILASAGYVVLDKASADKIDLMASQISSQQAVINRLETAAYYAGTTETDSTQPTGYIMPNDPLEMQTGCTLRCYPDEGRIVRAYVIDPLITTTTTTLPAATTKPFQPAVEVTTVPQTTEGVVAADESAVHGDELESHAASMSNVPSTNATTITNVQITSFGCIMLDKSLTGVPMFSVYFSGIADRSEDKSWCISETARSTSCRRQLRSFRTAVFPYRKYLFWQMRRSYRLI